MNLFLAVMISKQNDDDACVWYLLNILLDTIVGMFFSWILIRIIEVIARKNKIETLVSGNYYSRSTTDYDDYNIDYYIWAIQTGLWCIICTLMKLVIYFIMLSCQDTLQRLGDSMLQGVAVYPKLELIIVMVIVPFLTNCVQVNFLFFLFF